MPGIERAQGFEPRIDQLSKKIQEIKARKAGGIDEAMGVVAQNTGRQEARQAELDLQGLAAGLLQEDASVHRLNAMRVADLISDPFDD